MSSSRSIFLSLVATILLTSVLAGEVLQPTVDGAQLELPPGATLRQVEPIKDGWVAAGRLPAGSGTDLLIMMDGGDGADLLPVPVG